MKIDIEYPYTGDIGMPYVTVTMSAIEALNMECAVRGQVNALTESGAESVFIEDAEQLLRELVALNQRSEDWEDA